MSEAPNWLPDLIYFKDYNGDWQRYEDEIYSKFYTDFVESRPLFMGKPVFIKRELIKGKERSFWHCISEGPAEESRIPNFLRCERIRWIRAIIDHSDDPLIKKWTNIRKGKTRQLFWLEDAEFIVVLEDKTTVWVLWTAYPVTEEHRKRKLQREYEAYQKSQRRSD
jgi:hypothetical protein